VVGSRNAYVPDSFALLAYFEGEAGMSRVRAVFEGAEAGRHTVYLSVINLGEVTYITERGRGALAARRTLGAVDELPLELLSVSRPTVLAAAHVKARFAISYADAFAVVAAREHRGVVVTGDPEFRAVADAGIVDVEWLPEGR
jgi:predicted nucleic acid-binding protein